MTTRTSCRTGGRRTRSRSLTTRADLELLAGLVELAWSTGYRQGHLGLPSWRDDLSAAQRVRVTAATLARITHRRGARR